MWFLFALTVIAELAVLYLPGALIARSMRLSRLVSIIIAPVISIALYEVMAILFAKLAIFSSWQTLFLPLLCFGLLVFLLRTIVDRAQLRSKERDSALKHDWSILLLYVGVAILICGFYFILPLNGANSFCQEPDNAVHLSYIQSFIDSGNYSPLDASLYHAITNPAQDPTGGNGGGSFYPAAWHGVTALAASFFNVSASLAENASLFVFLAFVWPMNCFLLIRSLAPNNFAIKAIGSIVVMAFAAFPWAFLTFGPLYSNLAAFIMVPAGMYLVLAFFNVNPEPSCKAPSKFALILIFLFELIDLALLQTNAVFTLGILILPFVMVYLWQHLVRYKELHPLMFKYRYLLMLLVLAICVLVWLICFKLPIMQSIGSYPWPPFESLRQEVVNLLLVSYRDSAAQPVLGLLIIAGVIYLMVKKQHRWLIVSYLITCFLCIVAAVDSGLSRQLLIGFWYTDSYRIAAMTALAGWPLAVFGAYAGVKIVVKIFERIVSWCHDAMRPKQTFVAAVCSALLAIAIFYPNFAIPGMLQVTTGLGEFEGKWFENNNNTGYCVLDHDEQEFLDQVKPIVGNSLVINKPDDGSCFAYGYNRMDILYKRTGIDGFDSDSPSSKTIRNLLYQYSEDPNVQEAVNEVGAKYVLILDYDVDDDTQQRYWFEHYYENFWHGLDNIRDDTPGFKVVLKQGDMRLYEIEPIVAIANE